MNTFPLSEPLVQRLAWTLIHFVWQGFAIALLLALAIRLGGVRRSDWRYYFSLLALLAMTASPIATFVVVNVPTSIELPVQHSPAATPQSSIPHSMPNHLNVSPLYGASASDPGARSVTEPTATPSASAKAIDSHPDISRQPLDSIQFTWQRVQPWIVSVWIFGVALLSCRLLIGWVGVWQIRRRGIPAPGWLLEQTQRLAGELRMACPELKVSHRVQEAIALGFLRPMILLPAVWLTQMPPDMLEAVLAHELAHIRRHDLWINLFQRIVETLLFYHPAVWWLSRRLRMERELCCDELVVRITQNPLRYAETLEHIGRLSLASRSAPLIVSIMGSRSMLSVRIRNILRLQPQQQASWAWLAGVVPLLLAGAVYWSMTTGSTLSAQAEEDHSDESIVSVKFSGNNFHPEADLAKHVTARPGTNITPKQIKDDVNALIRTRWFAHVAPIIDNTDEGLVLTYRVTERPLISSVEYKGNNKISTEALSKLTQLNLSQPYDVSVNRECVRRIQEMYKEKGFAFVTVELARGDLQNDPDRDIVFQIDEGPKVKVSKVEFDDLRSRDVAFPEDRKREKTTILWLQGGEYSGDDDSERLCNYYHSLGYFDVEITPHYQATTDKSKVELNYRIDEGPRYRINDISIAGNEVFTHDQIKALIKVQPGQEYNQRQINKDVEAIRKRYGTTGRFFTKISPICNFPEEPKIVDLVYQIEEQEPRLSKTRLHYDGAAAKESQVQVGPFGRIEGEIVVDPHAHNAGFRPDSLKLVFRSIKSMREFANLEDGSGRQPSSEGRATVSVDASGKFSIDSLAAGYLKIESSLSSNSPFALIIPAVARVQAGQTRKLVLEVTTQATCHGFVRKRGSNEPIAGATVHLEQSARSTLRNRQQRVKTDAAGRYEATLLSGPVKIRLETRVEGFSTVHAWESPHFHAGTSLYYEVPGGRASDELPALELVPLEQQTGKLLDQQGQPASEHWEVLGYSSGIWTQFSGRANVQANGEFNIQFPSAYPPQVFGARPIVRGVDTPTHQLIVVSQQPLVLKFDGKAWPPTEPRAVDWRRVEIKISEMYPKSKVHLGPMGRQIVVRGQARDPEERSHIITIVRGEAINAPIVLDDGTQVMMEVTNEVVVPGDEGLKAYYRSLGYFDLAHQIDEDKVDRIRDVQSPKDKDPAPIAKESEAIASGIDKSQVGTRRLAFAAIDPKVPFNVRTMTARQPYRQRTELSGGVQVSVEEAKSKWQMRANQVLVEIDSHDKPATGPQDTQVHLQTDKYVLTTKTPLRMTLSGNISVVRAFDDDRNSAQLTADKVTIDFDRSLLSAEKARFKSNETILESDNIAISFRGGSFRVGTVPDASSQPEAHSIKTNRRLRTGNNDKEGASKLVGNWKLVLPSGTTHELKLTQQDDGCLRLSKNLNLSGTFAYQNKRLELIEPTQDNIFDFIWALQDDGSFKLIHEQHNVSAKYVGAILARAAADSENAANSPTTKIRSDRARANDREAARNLVGRWLLTLPTKDLLDVELTASDDGCLRLACRKDGDLVGRYSLNGDRLELMDHESQDTDFVWRLEDQNTLNLISERHKVGLAHVGAKLERIAAAVPRANVFEIPAEVLTQVRELAAASARKKVNPKSHRPAGLEDLESPEAIKRAVDRAMLLLADREKHADGLIQLRYMGDEALAALIAGSKSQNAQVAKWSCSALQHRGLEAVGPLSEALKLHPDSDVRSVAASALGQTFQPTSIPALIAALDDPDPQVRTSVLHSIKYPRDARAIMPLKRFVNDPGVGHVASDAIRHIQSPQGYAWWPADKLDLWQLCEDAHTFKGESYRDAELNQLMVGLKSDEGTITYCCLFALGRLNSKESVSAIIQAPLSEMKFHVLAELATPAAIEYLIQRLHSLNPQTRELAIRGLADGADRWAAPLLIALLDDPALKVEARKMEFTGRSSIDTWPESHRAHSALYSLFSRFGLTGEWRNLYANQTNNVPEEITNVKAWWKQHGADFVAGKKVPTPNLSTVFYNDP